MIWICLILGSMIFNINLINAAIPKSAPYIDDCSLNANENNCLAPDCVWSLKWFVVDSLFDKKIKNL